MMDGTMKNFKMPNVIKLNVFMLNAIMLSVIAPNVVAPTREAEDKEDRTEVKIYESHKQDKDCCYRRQGKREFVK